MVATHRDLNPEKAKQGEFRMVSFLATAMMAIGVLASTPESTEWQSDYGDAAGGNPRRR